MSDLVAHITRLQRELERLLAKVDDLKAKNSELQMLVKHDVAVEPYEREKIAVLEGELKGLVAKHDRLRAENERLQSVLEAMVRSITRECDQCAVGVIPFVPLDRVWWLLAYGERLRAENEKKQHVVDEQRKTGETVYPLSEGMDMVRELQRLRATALTASEAEWVGYVLAVSPHTTMQPGWKETLDKVTKIAHPEPQEGSNG